MCARSRPGTSRPSRSGRPAPSHRALARRMADPDDGRELRHPAGEPRVGVVVGRAGLARRRPAGSAAAVPVPRLDVLLEDPGHDGSRPSRRPRGARSAAMRSRCGRRGRRPCEDRRLVREPVCGERRVRGREIERADPIDAEADRRDGLELRLDPHARREVGDRFRAEVERESRVDGVVGERAWPARSGSGPRLLVSRTSPRASCSGLRTARTRYRVANGLIPRMTASVRTNILNVEPACLCASAAMSNESCCPVSATAIAWMSPVPGRSKRSIPPGLPCGRGCRAWPGSPRPASSSRASCRPAARPRERGRHRTGRRAAP